MNRLSNNNTSVKAEKKNVKLKQFRKIYNILCVISIILASSTVSASAATSAPSGVSTKETSQLVNIIFYILYTACGVYAISAVYSAVKGHHEEDPRTFKNGIASLIIAGAAVGCFIAIKKIFF